jgi:hypothetical protein
VGQGEEEAEATAARGMNAKLATYAFLGLPLVCYLLQSVAVYWQQGRYGMALALFSYAQANVGLILDQQGI